MIFCDYSINKCVNQLFISKLGKVQYRYVIFQLFVKLYLYFVVQPVAILRHHSPTRKVKDPQIFACRLGIQLFILNIFFYFLN